MLPRRFASVALTFVCCAAACEITAQTGYERYPFSTFAGHAGPGDRDGVGAGARFNSPSGVTVDRDGNVYVADTGNGFIRKITPDREVITVAGGAPQYDGPDGRGREVRFGSIRGLAADAEGNVVIADAGYHSVRKLSRDGAVTTVAGTRSLPVGHADGDAAQARFNSPAGLALDGQGNVYIADTGNQVIRKLTPAGLVTTVAGSPGASGNVDGNGSAARFSAPTGIALDSAGNIYVSDQGTHCIRKINAAGDVVTLAGGTGVPSGSGSIDGSGRNARFYSPGGISVDESGNIYVADTRNNTIRRVTPDGNVTTMAGSAFSDLGSGEGSNDGVGGNARFKAPMDVVVAPDGNLLIADAGNQTIRKVTPGAVVTTWAGLAGGAGFVDGARELARFNEPAGVAADGDGNLYVLDRRNGALRKVTPQGDVSTFATGFYFPFGIAIDRSGFIFVTEPSSGLIKKVTPAGVVSTYSGTGFAEYRDGPAATAGYFYPEGLAFDQSGNLFVADSGNDLIRKITPEGLVSTFAGTQYANAHRDGVGATALFDGPTGLAFDGAGNLFVSDSYNRCVRKITPDAVVTTLAGTPRRAGGPFHSPGALAVHRDGTLFVLDGSGGIQKVSQSGTVIHSVAVAPGNDSNWSEAGKMVGLGGAGITFGKDGFIYVSDSGRHEIRRGGPTALSELLNISTRANLRGGDDLLIGGFILSGTYYKPTAVRAIGPSLAAAGVSQALRDPKLEIRDSTGRLVAANDDWKRNSFEGRAIINEGLPPADDAESALVWSLLGQKPYTALVQAADAGAGAALVEVYNTTAGTSLELVNLSSRGFVGVDESVMIAGFIIGGGESPATVVLRALGPSLLPAGVHEALDDPMLSLHDSNGSVLAANDDWQEQADAIVATGIPPTDRRESALVVTLGRGNYTAVATGKAGRTGVGLVEIYKLPHLMPPPG
jgi:sugar lactone lactonase YvrE